jgi:hypothetical protein
MSMAIGHFAFGFTATVVILVATGLHRRLRRPFLIGVVGGLWAMVPDVGEFLPGNPPLDHTPWVNIFWFHYLLDTNEFADGLSGSVLLVALMAGTVFAVFAYDAVVWVRHRSHDVTIADGRGPE